MNKEIINNIANFAVKFPEEIANKECLTVDDVSLNFNQFSVLVISYAKKSAKNSIVFWESMETLSPFSKPRSIRPLAIFFTSSSSSRKVILFFED